METGLVYFKCTVCSSYHDTEHEFIRHALLNHCKVLVSRGQNSTDSSKMGSSVIKIVPSDLQDVGQITSHEKTHFETEMALPKSKRISLADAEAELIIPMWGRSVQQKLLDVKQSKTKNSAVNTSPEGNKKAMQAHAMDTKGTMSTEVLKDSASASSRESSAYASASSRETLACHFRCRWCDNEYNSSIKLHAHETNDHFRDECHACQICGVQFARLGELEQHALTHIVLKPFNCYCGESFFTADELELHEKSHVAHNKYVCYTCHKGFPQLTSLLAHAQELEHEA